MQIEISRIKGHLPWNIRFNKLKLTNNAAIILEIDKAKINSNPIALIWGELQIKQLSAENISWQNALPKSSKQSTFRPLSLPQIAIGEMHLPNINIAPKLAGKQALNLQLNIQGNVRKPLHFKGSLLTKTGIPTELSFNFKPTSLTNFLSDISLNEAEGGLIGSLLKLPPNQNINLNAHIKGDLQALNGNLQLLMQEKPIANLALITDYANHFSLQGGGEIPDFIALPNFIIERSWQISSSLKQSPNNLIIEDFSFNLGNIHLKSSGNYSDNVLQLSHEINALIDNLNYQINGDLQADLSSNQFKLKADAKLPELPQQIAEIIGESTEIAFKLNAIGAFTNPSAKLKITAQNLNPSKKLAHLGIGKQAEFLVDFDNNKGNLSLESGEIKAQSTAKLNKSKLDFSGEITHQTLSAVNFSGNFSNKTKQLNFELSGETTTISANNMKLNGASGEIALNSSNINDLSAWANIDASSDASALKANWLKTELNLNANFKQLQFNDLLLNELTAKIDNNNFKIAADGEHNLEKITLELGGTKSKNNYQLNALNGNYASYDFKLAEPTNLNFNDAQNWQLSPSKLKIGESELTIGGKQSSNQIALNIKLNPLSLQPLLIEKIPNIGNITMQGEMAISGKPNNPTLKLSSEIIAGEMAKSSLDSKTPTNLSLKINGDSNNNNLKLTSNLLSGAEQLGKAEINLPLILSFKPWQLDIPTTKPIKGNASMELAASRFNNWLSPLGHRIVANINANLDASGTIEAPKITADINTTKISYTNLTAGLCLRDGSLQAKYQGNQFTLNELTGTGDLGVGKINAKGNANFNSKQLNFTLNADNAAIFCSPALDGKISGNAKLNGNFNDMLLEGNFLLGKTSILIPSGGKTNIPYVEKIYKHELRKAKSISQNQPKIPLNLNVKVNAPKQIFVRGRGLDAEFAGELKIAGNINSPKLIGKLNSRRGRIALLGSTLTIREGKINFINNEMKKPYIELLGSTKTNNTEINIELRGAVLKPKLILSSNPALPQDEILALLIFGRPLDRISPFQALQLAQAAASLASGENGAGMLGSLRDVLGVDNLNIGEGADGQPTVGAGKYVTDKVYVGIEQGATPESRRLSTEIELSPTVTGKTSTNSAGEPSFGLEWRYDY